MILRQPVNSEVGRVEVPTSREGVGTFGMTGMIYQIIPKRKGGGGSRIEAVKRTGGESYEIGERASGSSGCWTSKRHRSGAPGCTQLG